MKRVMRYKRAGRGAFTLVEILIALAVVGVLFGLIFAFYKSAIDKSRYVEAVATVDSIGKAEEINQMNTGKYVAAGNTQEVNDKLGLDIESKGYNYKVVGVTNDNFIILAEKILDDINNGSLATEPTVIAKNRSGPVSPESVDQTPGATPGENSPESPTGGQGAPGGGNGSPGGNNPTEPPTTPPVSNQTGGGSSTRNAKLGNALNLLRGTVDGDYYYNLINDNNIPIVYAPLPVTSTGTVAGEWMPTYARDVDPNEPLHPGTIYINQALSSIWTEEQIAPIIAHEALHADCNYDPTKWANIMLGQLNAGKIPPPPLLVSGNLDWTDPINGVKYLNDTVQQEYNTFKEEIFVWQEVRGSQTSREYDTLLADYNNDQANGTTTFYDEIASRYPNPPYKAY